MLRGDFGGRVPQREGCVGFTSIVHHEIVGEIDAGSRERALDHTDHCGNAVLWAQAAGLAVYSIGSFLKSMAGFVSGSEGFSNHWSKGTRSSKKPQFFMKKSPLRTPPA